MVKAEKAIPVETEREYPKRRERVRSRHESWNNSKEVRDTNR